MKVDDLQRIYSNKPPRVKKYREEFHQKSRQKLSNSKMKKNPLPLYCLTGWTSCHHNSISTTEQSVNDDTAAPNINLVPNIWVA